MDNEFVWKGKAVSTLGDLSDALLSLASEEEAHAFMSAYLESSVHAYVNVGYMTGYFDSATAARINQWCQTSHPIFGNRTVSPEEAFSLGQRVAEEW